MLSKDGLYGRKEGGQWNGLIEMARTGVGYNLLNCNCSGWETLLLLQEVDAIAADLTQTWTRMEVIDFSKPFLASKLTVLMKVLKSL